MRSGLSLAIRSMLGSWRVPTSVIAARQPDRDVRAVAAQVGAADGLDAERAEVLERVPFERDDALGRGLRGGRDQRGGERREQEYGQQPADHRGPLSNGDHRCRVRSRLTALPVAGVSVARTRSVAARAHQRPRGAAERQRARCWRAPAATR